METNSSPDKKAPQASLLLELAKKKAQAQAQNKGQAFERFSKKTQGRPRSDSWPAVFGGRNGQGKP